MDNAAAEQFFMFLTLVVFGGLIFAYFAAKVSPKKGVKAAAVETGTGNGLLVLSVLTLSGFVLSTTPICLYEAKKIFTFFQIQNFKK